MSHYQDIKPRDDKKYLIWASLAVHVLVVTLVIVVPLMQLTDVPELESMTGFHGPCGTSPAATATAPGERGSPLRTNAAPRHP